MGILFEYSQKGCKKQIVTAGRLVTVLDMRPSTTNTLTTKRATKMDSSLQTYTIMDHIRESSIIGQEGKRAQTPRLPTMTPTSPGRS